MTFPKITTEQENINSISSRISTEIYTRPGILHLQTLSLTPHEIKLIHVNIIVRAYLYLYHRTAGLKGRIDTEIGVQMELVRSVYLN